MRTSATGTWAIDPRRPCAGFTLIEILVVMLIIGVMIVGAVLSTNAAGGGDRELAKERDRILALTDYLRDQAALQNREYGMRCHDSGYEFVVFNAIEGRWRQLEDDAVTRARQLPPGISITLNVEGREVILPSANAIAIADADADAKGNTDVTADELRPQIMLYSSGELSLFELMLTRKGGGGVRIAPSASSDRIVANDIAADPA